MSRGRMSYAALVMATLAGATACGGDATKVAVDAGGTYSNRSSAEEYCGLIAATSPQISHDLTAADPAEVQPVISTIGDLATVAPEEIKADLGLLQGYLQVVIDANGEAPGVGEEDLAQADAALGEVGARVTESVEQTCGVALE